jgi:hypothetical protein
MKLQAALVNDVVPTSNDGTSYVGVLVEQQCLTYSTDFIEDRHMLRHQQKDEEAGGKGLGVVCTRKRLWRDADGNIVTERPRSIQRSDASSTSFENLASNNEDNRPQVYEPPVSPPPSLTGTGPRIQDDFSCFVAPKYLQAGFDFPSLMNGEQKTSDFFVESHRTSQPSEPLAAASNNVDFNDVFIPDTG